MLEFVPLHFYRRRRAQNRSKISSFESRYQDCHRAGAASSLEDGGRLSVFVKPQPDQNGGSRIASEIAFPHPHKTINEAGELVQVAQGLL
jgi:hypothetical protein